MLPLMLPMAQHSVLSPFQVQLPVICARSRSSIWRSVSSWSRLLRYTSVSRMFLYCVSTSLSFIVSRTMLPFSSSTTITSCSRKQASKQAGTQGHGHKSELSCLA